MPQIRTAIIPAGELVSNEISIDSRNLEFEATSIVTLVGESYQNATYFVQAKVEDSWYDIYDTYGLQFTIKSVIGKHYLPADIFKDVNAMRLRGAVVELTDSEFKVLLADVLEG